MKIAVTGSKGFVGKNLIVHLQEMSDVEVVEIHRGTDIRQSAAAILSSDVVIHLAGENRPNTEEAFDLVNRQFTVQLCELLGKSKKLRKFIFASTTQADLDNPYGRSKAAAEHVISDFAKDHELAASIYRLPGVFGKWCRPNYNSVVATFCNNIANDIELKINQPDKALTLVHIDDVVRTFIDDAKTFCAAGVSFPDVMPRHEVTVGELAEKLRSYRQFAPSLFVGRVGHGFERLLYSTYVSYLTGDQLLSDLKVHSDDRGNFVEMLKTSDSGQISYFTAAPNVTRGEHYHHVKTEKFLVVSGTAKFKFRNISSNEMFELVTDGGTPQVVDTIPGWAHDITNIGSETLLVLLWANEVFSVEEPDTYRCKV